MWGIIDIWNFDKSMRSSKVSKHYKKGAIYINEQTLINCQCKNSYRPKLLKSYSQLTRSFWNHQILWEKIVLEFHKLQT